MTSRAECDRRHCVDSYSFGSLRLPNGRELMDHIEAGFVQFRHDRPWTVSWGLNRLHSLLTHKFTEQEGTFSNVKLCKSNHSNALALFAFTHS